MIRGAKMPFKVVISDPESGKSYQVEVKDPEARKLLGLGIGDKFDGSVVGLPGYELQITGGTDRDGFAMRPDVAGSGRVSILLAGGSGFKPKRKGERRRKRVRGSRISEALVQVNTKVVKRGEKPIQEIFQPKGPEKGT
jgi:small subunit ribosomal protein S6e